MKRYNQQIEDAYTSSRRQGALMRDREIERSSGQDRRNRYRDDRFNYPHEHAAFDDSFDLPADRTDRYGYERSVLSAQSRFRGEAEDEQRRGQYPDTYRSAMSGYMSDYVGDDRGRRDYRRGTSSEGNLFGDNFGLHRGKGPKDYRRPDARISDELCERLTDDPYVDASEIEIQVQDGEVILTGVVRDRSQKRRAEDIVEAVSGIRNVENRIRVSAA